jgi:hypothetical protein
LTKLFFGLLAQLMLEKEAIGCEKGKPLERAGRKAIGLSPHQADKVAGLPNLCY